MGRFVRIAALALAGASLGAACHTTAVPAVVRDAAAPHVNSPRPGTGSVVGIVADSADGFPVIGAEVYFTRDSVIGVGTATVRKDLPQATTDRGGGFAFKNLPPGEYTLAFADLDHMPMRTVVVVEADEIRTLTLRPRRPR